MNLRVVNDRHLKPGPSEMMKEGRMFLQEREAVEWPLLW